MVFFNFLVRTFVIASASTAISKSSRGSSCYFFCHFSLLVQNLFVILQPYSIKHAHKQK